jgi:alcohol dehydrogenase class IV
VIVRWKLGELPDVLRGRRTFLLATERWDAPVEVVGRRSDLPTEEEIDVGDAEVVLAFGGGSTIDTGKATSARTGLPLVSVPTTYSGAEWTKFFGVRDRDRRIRGGGRGSHNEAIVYDVDLTLDLPRDVTGGTALNALAHAAEALYVGGRDPDADPIALEGAALISEALPQVLADPGARGPRDSLLLGAARGGEGGGRAGRAAARINK